MVALQLRSPRLMLRYDATADAWQPIAQDRYPFGDQFASHILLAYDASVDRLVGYQLGEVRLFDIRTGTWSAPGSPSPPFRYGGYFSFGGEIAYDEAAQRTILFSAGIVIAYDAATDHWETLSGNAYWDLSQCAGHAECRMNHSMVYDPVNERLVVYGGSVSTADYAGPSDDVLANDTRTREWSTLLAVSDGADRATLTSSSHRGRSGARARVMPFSSGRGWDLHRSGIQSNEPGWPTQSSPTPAQSGSNHMGGPCLPATQRARAGAGCTKRAAGRGGTRTMRRAQRRSRPTDVRTNHIARACS